MMRRIAMMIAATVWVAACSRPQESQNVIQIDDDLGDAGPDVAITQTELPLIEGELVAGPLREDASVLRISDAGEFLFVVQDEQWFGWLGKEQTVPIDFASWPDHTRPDDGPPSVDTAFDDTYFWFLSETEDGWILAGVEHFLGNASPLFGQPIIIIDLGPIQKPRGIERYGDRFVMVVGPDLDNTSELIIAGENIDISRRPIEGSPVLNRFDGALFTQDDGVLYLSVFDPGADDLRTRWSRELGELPLALATDGAIPYVIRGNGELWEESSMRLIAQAAPREDPLIDVHSSVVAWTATDGIRVYDGEFRRIDVSDVDALFVDDTHVWWSNAEGVFRAPLD